LIELGDLSGIIHDLNSDEIIGGNQRSKIMEIKPEMVTIVEKYATPTKTGTVATGFITYNGEKYAYRQVSWTQKQCEKANIVANKAGGSWDMEILANQFELDDLKDWGFENKEFGLTEVPEKEIKESLDFKVQIKIFVIRAEDWVNWKNKISNFLNDNEIKYEVVE
jgi:hypothetical protein